MNENERKISHIYIKGDASEAIEEGAAQLAKTMIRLNPPGHKVLIDLDEEDMRAFTLGYKCALVDYIFLLAANKVGPVYLKMYNVNKDAPKIVTMQDKENLLKDCLTALTWIVPSLEYAHNETKSNFGNESEGNYSPELKHARETLVKLGEAAI